MAKSCDFCKRMNQYICDPLDHCGECVVGQKALRNENIKEPERVKYKRESY